MKIWLMALTSSVAFMAGCGKEDKKEKAKQPAPSSWCRPNADCGMRHPVDEQKPAESAQPPSGRDTSPEGSGTTVAPVVNPDPIVAKQILSGVFKVDKAALRQDFPGAFDMPVTLTTENGKSHLAVVEGDKGFSGTFLYPIILFFADSCSSDKLPQQLVSQNASADEYKKAHEKYASALVFNSPEVERTKRTYEKDVTASLVGLSAVKAMAFYQPLGERVGCADLLPAQ